MKAMTVPRILSFNAATRAAVCREAAVTVREGGVIAVPTESFYALACDPTSADAVARVCAIKGRPAGKPILVLVAGRAQVGDLVSQVSPAAAMLMERCWPGPLTLVLPARSELPEMLTAGTGTIGVRWSAHRDLQMILDATGALTGTSANRSGEEPCRLADEIARTCADSVDLIVDAGPTAGGLPSTVLDVTGRPRLLREGAVSTRQLRELLARIGETLA